MGAQPARADSAAAVPAAWPVAMHCACTRIEANAAGSAATSPPAASRFGHFAEISAESGIAPGYFRNERVRPLDPARWRSIGWAASAMVSAGRSPETNSAAVTRWSALSSRHSRNPLAAAVCAT